MLIKTGDWTMVQKLIKSIPEIIDSAANDTIKTMGLKAEQLAIEHIQNQDLSWPPLQPETLEYKKGRALSDLTLVATSSYFQAITSWAVKGQAFAGVKRSGKSKNGTPVVMIAKIHEYGTKFIPARPLWRPVRRETKLLFKRNQYFKKRLAEKLKRFNVTII